MDWTSYSALAVGALAVLCSCAFVGRLAGFSVAALWSAGVAYFLMAPTHSLRVGDSRNMTALALYGAVGIALVRMPLPRRPARREDGFAAPIPPVACIDLKTVIADCLSASGLSEELKRRQIEVEASFVPGFRCSRDEAVRILTPLFSTALADPRVRRISVQPGRRPGVELLFVCAHNTWPLPHQRTMVIGRADGAAPADDPGWPEHFNVTWFENGYSRIYQVTIQ